MNPRTKCPVCGGPTCFGTASGGPGVCSIECDEKQATGRAVASKPDSRTGRMSNKAYQRGVVERAYQTPPNGNAKKLHDAMARAVGLD